MITHNQIRSVIEQKAFAHLGAEPIEKCLVDHEMSEYLTNNVIEIYKRREYYVEYCKVKKELYNE